ncbi:MAG: hypothetical protein JRH20_24420, partial [Deltaproteobacteria bacterium]|nr:hypothetical protein [Deltaproteobacteria bacterium]
SSDGSSSDGSSSDGSSSDGSSSDGSSSDGSGPALDATSDGDTFAPDVNTDGSVPVDTTWDTAPDSTLDNSASVDTSNDTSTDSSQVSDATLACLTARVKLELYLQIYQGCILTSECSYTYTPPCACEVFLTMDPKKLDLKPYEEEVINTCYLYGCPPNTCEPSQAKCINRFCDKSYTN